MTSHYMRRVISGWIGGLGMLGGLLGCGGDATAPAILTGAQAYWKLQLNHHAVTLALTSPYDTIQLTTTALSAAGTPLDDIGTVSYQTADSNVTVTPTGLVAARYATPNGKPAKVIAQLSYQAVTLADTLLIQVTKTVPVAPLDSLSIQPLPGDSAKTSVVAQGGIGNKTLPARGTDTAGRAMSNILVYYTSSNTTIATIDRTTGLVYGHLPGQVTFYAATTMYGVTRYDSLSFSIGYSSQATIQIIARTLVDSINPILDFQPSTITVGVGAIVHWIGTGVTLNTRTDIIFDDPTQVQPACGVLGCFFTPATEGGNISIFPVDSTDFSFRSRSFPISGTYHYHSTQYRTQGTIIVHP